MIENLKIITEIDSLTLKKGRGVQMSNRMTFTPEEIEDARRHPRVGDTWQGRFLFTVTVHGPFGIFNNYPHATCWMRPNRRCGRATTIGGWMRRTKNAVLIARGPK